MIKNTIFFLFFITNLFFLSTYSTRIDPVLTKTRSDSFVELTRQSNDITQFTDSLREDHVY